MKLLSNIDHATQKNLFDYAVVDQNHESIGTLHSMWNNEATGKLEFLGVKTGWLFGSNHVVPADRAQLDDVTHTIEVPYLLDQIKDAPAFDADAEIKDEEEAQIYRYYGVQGTSTGPSAQAHSGLRSDMATVGLANKAPVRDAKAGADIEVALREEQVKVGKRTVDAGAVRLRKVVRTEIVNQPVEVRREEVVVERVNADQVHSGMGTSDFEEEVIDVPLTREEVVVGKETHVTGGVRVHKTAETETQNVSETVRKEDVEVLRNGKVETESGAIKGS